MSDPENNWRLFVGIELPADLTRPIAALQEKLRAARLFQGRYPRPEHLHLTLRFLGELPAAAAADVADRLQAVRFAPFTAMLEGLGTFGGRRPRVVWLGVTGDALVRLQRAVEHVLIDLGETTNAEEYRPHLTLARVQSAPPGADLQPQLETLAPRPLPLVVDHFALVRSELRPEGPRHTAVRQYPAVTAVAEPSS